ncbi:hypothetical protein PTKIN_Ptkin14bG0206500 [Pterospermum kingtungense]
MGILNLLLKRYHGNTFSKSYYFSLLSTERGQTFVVKENIYLPEIYRICEVHGPCDGLLCLQVTNDKEEGIGNYLHFILSFDFANEKFSTISLPNFGGSFEHFNLEILDFNGLLGAFVFTNEGDEKSFDLWVMNNGLWTREFSIGPISGVHMPLGFSENGELFLEGSNRELLLFDPTTRATKNLGIHDHPEVMRLIAYVESLVPLNGTSELEEHVVRQSIGHHQIDIGNKQV